MIHNRRPGISTRTARLRSRSTCVSFASCLQRLGGTDAGGEPTLGGWKVRFEEGCVILPWLGGKVNRVAEEFAIRLHRQTGCSLADREHGRLIEPSQLLGERRTKRLSPGDVYVRPEVPRRGDYWCQFFFFRLKTELTPKGFPR